MSDLIEIGIVVDSKPVNNLVAALGKASNAADLADKNFRSLEKALKQGIGGGADNLLKAFSRLERAGMSLSDVNKGLAQDAKMLAQANQTQVNSLLNVDKASKSARNSAEAMKQAFREQAAATKEQAAAAARVTAEEERLRLKYVQGHAAMEVYSRELNDLAMARKKDIISADQQKQAVAELNMAMAKGTGAFATMGTAAQVGGRRVNSSGMLIQQAGYQFGDFAVQVQGGTNPMVAFGQQATQMIGAFNLLPRATLAATVGIGALRISVLALVASLGVILPVATAIGAFLMRAGQEAKKAAEGVDDLESAVKGLESSVKDFLLTKKAASMGITKEELLGIDNIEAAEKALGAAIKKLEEYQTVSGALGGASYQQIFLAAKSLFVDAEEEHLAAIKAVTDAETLLANLRVKQADERFRNFNKERVELEEELAMAQEIARFGEDSNQVAKLALEQRIASFDRSIDQQVAANELADYQGAQLKEINAELARSESSYETIEEKVQRISREIEAATQFKLSTVFEAASRAIDGMNSRLATTLSQLGGIMSSINSVLIDTVAVQAESEALAAGKSASQAANAARVAREVTRLTGTGNAEDLTLAEAAAITALTEALERNGVASDKLKAQQDALRDAAKGSKKSLEDLKKEVDKLNKTAAEGLTPFDKYNKALKNLDVLRAAGLSQAAYSMEIERLNDELAKSLPMVNDVADAFGDFLARGMTDFKSFANSIFKSFQNMLAQMIATAARNKILISLGATGSVAGTAASAGVGSAIGTGVGAGIGGIAAFGSGIGSGLSVVGSGFMAGGFGGAATATAGAVSGGIGMGGAAGFGTALGAALPVIAAVALAVSFFRSKTKELDSGLNVTIDNMDALVTSFKTVEKSRFFGLSKKVSTTEQKASAEISDPIVSAVQQIQQSVLTAAEAFGFGADAFDNFSYEFKLSLKGLSEEQQMQKINEELTKMGDSFASLTGHFSSMNELLEAAEQRYQIENRLLMALGRSSEVLARNRERELAATHELNRGMLQAAFALEDANAAAAATKQAGEAAVAAARQQYNDAVSSLNDAISRERGRVEDAARDLASTLGDQLSLAKDRLSGQTGIVDALRNAIFGRRGETLQGQELQLRQANDYLRSLVGQGRFEDEEAFERALGVVEKPSVDLFENFVDYQRSFGRTSNVIDDLLREQEKTLTADQQAVEALEIQIARAEEWKNQQLEALNRQSEISQGTFDNISTVRQATDSVQAAILNLNQVTIKAQNAQIEATNAASRSQVAATQSLRDLLQDGFEEAFDVNLRGDNLSARTSPKILEGNVPSSVTQAVNLANYLGTSEFGGGGYQVDTLQITSASQLKSMANALGILTSGKTGVDIITDIGLKIADLTGDSVGIAASQAVKTAQFALGGMHSGGARIVGEQGPELEFTGPSRIASANETKRLLSGGDDSKEEIRNLREDLRQMHKETLMVYAKIVRLEKDQRDTLRAWNVTGLPETRT